MPKDEFITMRIASEVKEKLRIEAEKQDRTLSNLIAMILKKAISK
jgi:antitoxin component of RelBE/YafQ-DinJ toxin-antitoxin module